MDRRLRLVRTRSSMSPGLRRPGRDLAAFGCGALATAALVALPWPGGVAAAVASAAVVWAGSRRRERVGGTAAEHWADVAREMERSRRVGTPLTLVRLECGAVGVASADLVARARLGVRAAEGVFADGRDAYVVVPGSREAAMQVVRRLVDRLGLDPAVVDGVRLATFPSDALTLTGLVEQLMRERARAPRSTQVSCTDDGTTAEVV